VDELTSEFDRDGHRGPIGEHTAADAIPGLDDHDLLPGVHQIPGGAQTGGTRTDHDNVELMVVGCPSFSRRACGESAGREGGGSSTDEDATAADRTAVAFHIRVDPSITWLALNSHPPTSGCTPADRRGSTGSIPEYPQHEREPIARPAHGRSRQRSSRSERGEAEALGHSLAVLLGLGRVDRVDDGP
jgi:hypothetical protein